MYLIRLIGFNLSQPSQGQPRAQCQKHGMADLKQGSRDRFLFDAPRTDDAKRHLDPALRVVLDVDDLVARRMVKCPRPPPAPRPTPTRL